MMPNKIKKSPPTSNWVIVQYYSAIIISVSIIILLINTFIGIMIAALAFLLLLPAWVISFISFFTSLSCNTNHKRTLLIWHIVNILAILLLIYNPNEKCDAHIMEEHYMGYHIQMDDLYRNVYHRLKPGYGVYLEFEDGRITIFHVLTENEQGENSWEPSKEKVDSLLILSGLDRKILHDIKNALDDIHCISISVTASPDKPYGIGFRRVLLDKYDYLVFPKPLTPGQQDTIGSDPGNILYSPQVVFRYNTGAIGNLNFPGKEEYLQSTKY